VAEPSPVAITNPIGDGPLISAARRKRILTFTGLALLCLPNVIFNLRMPLDKGNSAIDFTQFYAASRLAGTGRLYNTDELLRIEKQYDGPPIPCGRLPVVSYAMRALSWMPFNAARSVWLALGLAGLLGFALWWPAASRAAMFVALASSIPVGIILVVGQDTPLFLLCFAAGLALIERRRPVLAGTVFALCLCKYHLAIGLPIALAAQRRWKTLAAAAGAVAGLLAACFLIEGPGWPLGYLAVLRNPLFSVADSRMPNLRGVAYWLPGSAAIEAAGAVVVAVLLCLACRRNPPIGWTGSLTAAASLILGHHAYASDCVLLVPAALVGLQRPLPAWLKMWGVLLATPVLTLALVSNAPYIGQWMVVAYVVSALAWTATAKRVDESGSEMAPPVLPPGEGRAISSER
jgi:hypothetical protein